MAEQMRTKIHHSAPDDIHVPPGNCMMQGSIAFLLNAYLKACVKYRQNKLRVNEFDDKIDMWPCIDKDKKTYLISCVDTNFGKQHQQLLHNFDYTSTDK